ncbi:hypothetical protein STRIP9103_04773 [Streptomyces ipomoeae 91-03]|uniref:Uncharacterized protein n=1 Tax=Streptomyces ipomoeae 91-03 TaxID=698759 RepID=L1KP81_9ACTN|nr:hypothetical protein STRIP9103_04773 [Streptomyces ipomoeae 91-03]
MFHVKQRKTAPPSLIGVPGITRHPSRSTPPGTGAPSSYG